MSSDNQRKFSSKCEECGGVNDFDLTEDEWCDDDDLLECEFCHVKYPIACWNSGEVTKG